MKWKRAPGFDRYEVSSCGQVRSTPGDGKRQRLLKPDVCSAGYHRVTLCQDNRLWRVLLHRLVWFSFAGDIASGLQINHKNGDKSDNRLRNLELMTAGENIRHGHRLGLYRPPKGEDCHNAKLTEANVRAIRARLASNHKVAHVAEDFGVARRTIRQVRDGHTWTHVL